MKAKCGPQKAIALHHCSLRCISSRAISTGAFADAWTGHPNRVFVESTPDFLAKAAQVLELIRAALPACCQGHELKAR